MKEMKRICELCGIEIIYTHRISFWKAKKANKPCTKCIRKEVSNRPEERLKNSERQRGKRSGEANPFYNKKHTDETKSKLRKNAKMLFGKDNFMYGKSFYDVWVEKYGKEIADIKLDEFKIKQSKNSSGELNGMFGKPSPTGSGNGWSGWYKGWYFRSILELSYMVNVIERYNIEWKTGETIHIDYVDESGTKRTYSPDFILNNKYLIECKPKSLINSKNVIIKTEAAKEYCIKNNLTFKIISPIKLNDDKLKNMFMNGEIVPIKRYEEKFKKYFNLVN